jgi:hypothetical protein
MFGGMRRSNNVSLWTGEDLEWEKEEEGGGRRIEGSRNRGQFRVRKCGRFVGWRLSRPEEVVVKRGPFR